MDKNDNNSLTIACVSVAGGLALLNCIRSVLHSGIDCIVVVDEVAITNDITILANERNLEIICTKDCSVPERRAIAVASVKTEWIALIEDTCTIGKEWQRGCKEIITSESIKAGSGPVRLGRSLSTRARALYCSDYGKYFPSALKLSDGGNTMRMLRTDTLPGVNLLYRRETVMQYIDDEGLIESEVHRRMIEDGFDLYLHEDLAVTLEHADENGATFRSRFTHGRLYGGLRAREMTINQRILRIMSSVLLPFILSYRSLSSLANDRRRILGTAFFIVAFETAWSCGEFTGYLLGCGKSLEHWK